MSQSIELNAIEIPSIEKNYSETLGILNHNDRDLSPTTNKNNSEKEITKLTQVDINVNLYQKIFSIMIPYVFAGCPFNYCFHKKNKSCINSSPMKIYTFLISILTHGLMIFWFARLIINLISSKHLTNDLVEDIFIFSYIIAGVIGLDIIWINRKSIDEVLSLLDFNPINERCSILLTKSLKLKWSRWKFYLLALISYVLVALLILYYGFLIYSLVKSFDQNELTTYWLRTMRFLTIYTLYFFISDAVLLISLVWSLKLRIIHLNLFIKNLVNIQEIPKVDDIEIIKTCFQCILKITKKIDSSFTFYIPVFIGFLFFGVIYFVSKTIDVLKRGNGESVEFISVACLSSLMSLVLFYGMKELSDVHELSSLTKSILYEYVLNTKPEERTTAFFEEINFVVNGLLTNPATFTLLGQIKLNKEFLAKIIMVIYSYTIIFNQFERSIQNEKQRT